MGGFNFFARGGEGTPEVLAERDVIVRELEEVAEAEAVVFRPSESSGVE